jgi:hypothetical protein
MIKKENIPASVWRLVFQMEGREQKCSLIPGWNAGQIYNTANRSMGILSVVDGMLVRGPKFAEFMANLTEVVSTINENVNPKPAIQSDLNETVNEDKPKEAAPASTKKSSIPYNPESFPPGAAPPNRSGLPRDFQSVVNHFFNRKFKDPQAMAKKFVEHYSATGWKFNGSDITNWIFIAVRWRDDGERGAPSFNKSSKGDDQAKALERQAFAGKEEYL